MTHAVFLSYASEDSAAAERIAMALRAGGIEVWFDQSELRGGDAWDQSIRRQIKNCALFVAIVSRHTHERVEGYFRLEWKLAVDRSHLIMTNKAFLLPVVIDDTGDGDENVPDRFREVQWTHLPGGETPPAFVERTRRLLSGEISASMPGPTTDQSGPTGVTRAPVQVPWSSRHGLLIAIAAGVVVLGGLVYFATERSSIPKLEVSSRTVATSAAPSAFRPPPHSIAVLPFINMSGDKEQDYFSDGLSEELLNDLARINELQVAARTSAFSFKGKDVDIDTIAHKLNVCAVLEGSVRRSGHTVRITAQLINAITGFHLWSKSYDRDLGDVLKLQTEIASAVAESLKVSLLGSVADKIEVGGTRNPGALDAYLRASRAFGSRHDPAEIPKAISVYDEAIRLDPSFALAFASRSIALEQYAGEMDMGAAVHAGFASAEADARRAIALAPELPEAHLALASILEVGFLDFAQASVEYERARALAPGNAEVLRASGAAASYMGHFASAIAAVRRAVVLDPLSRAAYGSLSRVLYNARQYEEASAAAAEAIRLNPDFVGNYSSRGFAFYELGDLERARAACEVKPNYWLSQQCLTVVYDKLGRHSDAQTVLARMQAALGNAYAYQYATIYAQWGNRPKALEWLDTAMRLRDPGLESLKTDPLMDPLRNEPRFQAALRKLKFPD